MDRAWWNYHVDDLRRNFAGELVCPVKKCQQIPRVDVANCGNSGAGAIQLAVDRGAQRVILLGYDCHKRGGAHWHGDHPRQLRNAGSIGNWPGHFRTLAKRINATVINCSPGTALREFECQPLEDALGA
jgi:hypothetical protein